MIYVKEFKQVVKIDNKLSIQADRELISMYVGKVIYCKESNCHYEFIPSEYQKDSYTLAEISGGNVMRFMGYPLNPMPKRHYLPTLIILAGLISVLILFAKFNINLYILLIVAMIPAILADHSLDTISIGPILIIFIYPMVMFVELFHFIANNILNGIGKTFSMIRKIVKRLIEPEKRNKKTYKLFS